MTRWAAGTGRGLPWTLHDVKILTEMRTAGQSKAAIAKALGVTEQRVHDKLKHMKLRSGAPVSPRGRRAPFHCVDVAKIDLRPCMTCGNDFPSQGKHNRMCGECRNRA